MKCKGKIKEKNRFGKMIKRTCGEKLSEHAIFCHVCGEPTNALSAPLSSKANWKETWIEFKGRKSKFYPFAIFIILTAFLLVGLSVYFGSGNFFDNNYLFINLFLLITVPLVLIPLSFKKENYSNYFTIKLFFLNLKHYPKFFLFTLINILYFFLMKIICTGYLLNIAIDPVLHIVRLVMVLYWIAIVVPAPVLMVRKSLNPIKAIIVSYKAGKETRWQQFFLAIRIVLVNVIGAAIVGLGLLVTIPLSYLQLEKYYSKMEEFELFEK